jgi:hypothetical protein
MRLAHSAIIVTATLAIGGGRVEADDWEPQPGQGTYLQVPEFSSFYIQPVSGSPSAVGGVFQSASGQTTFTATAIVKTASPTPPPPTTVPVKLIQTRKHNNAYGTPETPAPFEYQILYRATGLEKPLCGPNYNWALAIPGRYSKDGVYHPGPEVSFACIPYETKRTLASGYKPLSGGGIAAKCIDWGYPPWRPKDKPLPWVGHTSGGKDLELTDKNTHDIHQACLYMGTADYCGNGNPHTVDGTWIAAFNDVTIKPEVMNPGGHLQPTVTGKHFPANFGFEAAWRPPVAGNRKQRPTPGGALCVTKTRWATRPPDLGTNCPSLQTTLAGGGHKISVPFCERYSETELENLGAMLVSYSIYIDAGLYRCNNSTTPSRSVTTIADDLDTPNMSPPVMYKFKKDNSFTCTDGDFQGAILRPSAKNLPLPEGFPDWNGVALYRHDMPGGRYRTDTSPDPDGSLIGYLLPPATPCPGSHWCGKELKVYDSLDATGNTISVTTTSPSTGSATSLGFLINLKPQ